MATSDSPISKLQYETIKRVIRTTQTPIPTIANLQEKLLISRIARLIKGSPLRASLVEQDTEGNVSRLKQLHQFAGVTTSPNQSTNVLPGKATMTVTID